MDHFGEHVSDIGHALTVARGRKSTLAQPASDALYVTEAQAYEALLEQFATKWEDLHPDADAATRVPYTFADEPFTPDALGTLGAWARLTVEPTTSEQATFGQAPYRKFERRGAVFVQLFAPLGEGSGKILQLVEDVREVFEGMRISEINLFAASARRIDDPAWTARVVTIPYRLLATR